MSDSQGYEEVTVSADGITVVKRFEEDEFPVPAIAFEFVSEREEDVTVTLTDDVPEGVEVEDLGFHPEYGSEYWTIDEDQISFEKDLEAHAEYTTVYGIRATGADDVEQFLTDPALAEVDPPLPEEESATEGAEDIVPESDNDIVKDVISGEGEIPGLEEEDETEDGEEIETLDLKDPNASGEDVASGADADADASEDGETASVNANGSIVSAMATEIRQNEVAVRDLKLVQRAIEEISDETGSSSAGGAQDARVTRIQNDIADLRAYTDALEEFLDENGTGEQLIEDFETRLDEFSADLAAMESDLSDTAESVESVDSEMEDVRSEMDTVASDVDDIESSVENMEDEMTDLEATVSDLESEVTEGDVDGRLEEIESELEELRDWQNQIKSTFGG